MASTSFSMPGQAAQRVAARRRDAVVGERALVGVEALPAGGNLRRAPPRELAPPPAQVGRDLAPLCASQLAQVGGTGQGVDVNRRGRPHVLAVEDDDAGRADPQPAALQHEQLHGEILQVYVLDPGRGLHLLDAPPPARPPDQGSVDADTHAGVLEGALDNRGHTRVRQRAAGGGRRRGVIGAVVLDADAARIAQRRERPDLVPLPEEVLLRGRGLAGNSGPQALEVQALVALHAGDVAALGQQRQARPLASRGAHGSAPIRPRRRSSAAAACLEQTTTAQTVARVSAMSIRQS